MPPTFSPLWMQSLTGSDYTPRPRPSPPSSPQPYKVRSPWLSLPRNAISLHRKQPLGVTTVSSPSKTRNITGADLGGGCRGCAPSTEMTYGFLIQLVFCRKKKTMWFIGVEVEQETSAPPPKKNPGSAPVLKMLFKCQILYIKTMG